MSVKYEVLKKLVIAVGLKKRWLSVTTEELLKKDVAIPAQYMKTAVEVMRHGDDSVPDYMIWLQTGDFTLCPA